MFTLRKLLRLPYKTRLRKLVLLIQKQEQEQASLSRLKDTASLMESIEAESEGSLKESLLSVREIRKVNDPESLLRVLNTIRHQILRILEAEPSEWDLIIPETGGLDEKKRLTFDASVFLEDIRSPFNVGSIFRSAESFGVSHVYLTPDTPLPSHKKAVRTSRGCNEIIPWSTQSLEQLGENGELPVFALETGGASIETFQFPQRGIVLIGSEELGLSPAALKLADQSAGRVSIPLYGAKQSLNVSVAFGILMHRWSRFLISGTRDLS